MLAGRHDRIYPPEHAPLVEALLDRGAAVSEMPFSYGPRARDFPRRNRLIFGLSLGIIVVVEAAQKSGSLITDRMALEQNREVFAVPDSPARFARGGNQCPHQAGRHHGHRGRGRAGRGASDHQPSERRPSATGPASLTTRWPNGRPTAHRRQTPTRIVALLGPTAVPVDDLIRLSGASSTVVQMTRLELKLAGRLKRQQGARVALFD